ncbi:MAG: NmrA family NAD(P)-binding protein [Archangium sp.]
MFVVAGVTGNTGKVVAETLLVQGLPVRVIVRDAAKGESWKKKGAEVVVADLHDAKALTEALKGAQGAYLLNPPDFAQTELVKAALSVAEAVEVAVKANKVPHVVFLSSIAAQREKGTGPIVTLHAIEKKLSAVQGTHFTFLRAGYFMENLLSNLHPMKEQGVFPAMFSKPLEMVATADIGATAVELLRQGTSAPKVVELAGPAPRTLSDIAPVFGKKLGKTINLAPVPLEAQVEVLKGVGLPETWAKVYAEMNAATEHGLMTYENTPRRGLVSIERFVDTAVR